MELILVRHGLPERQEVADGRADPPLSATGHKQAECVAEWLLGDDIDAIYSSTMNRARQTAEPYARTQGLTITQREGLVEYDRHAGSYVPMEDLRTEDPEAWRAFVSGGYNDTLDIHQFHATVVNALEKIVADHSSQRVAVFCHGGVINVWTAHVLGLTPSMFFEPKYTSIHRYLCARSGERNLVCLNEAAHLKGTDLI
jgi:probable phosphoglycerate mutase